jgi:hypothetical protein
VAVGANETLRHRSGGEVTVADDKFVAVAHLGDRLQQFRTQQRRDSCEHRVPAFQDPR